MSDIAYTQNNTDQGELKIQVTARGSNRPITNARIAISYSGDPDSIVEEVNTDASGMSEQITLPAPPLEFSMEPGEEQPFSQYSIQVDAEGFRPFTVSGIELFSKQLSLQEVRMDEVDAPGNPVDTIVIPVNTLWGGRAASTDALCKKSSCGLNDPIMVLAYVVLFLPYTVQYVTSSFTQISDSLMAAGQVFGGSPAYILRRITLPLIRQGIATGWMMTFIIAFRELVTASLIAPPNTLVVSTFIVREFEQGSVSVGMAMAVLCVLFSTTALLILNTVIDHRKVH